MVQFVNLENMVPFLDGFEKFGVAPRASNATLRDGMFAPGSFRESFGQFFFHARSAKGEGDSPFATVRQ